jgi:hypothetical protein
MWEQKILQLAAKLDANNSPQASAMCYLAAFQVYPAIDVYRRAKLYKYDLSDNFIVDDV